MTTITVNDIKSYLVISDSSFDSNITTILNIWNPAVDSLIDSAYDTAEYAPILKAGKTLYICSKLRDVLPKDIVGRASERIEYILGDAKTVIDNRADKQEIRSDALWILRPYLKDEDLLTSSTEDIVAEFSAEDNRW